MQRKACKFAAETLKASTTGVDGGPNPTTVSGKVANQLKPLGQQDDGMWTGTSEEPVADVSRKRRNRVVVLAARQQRNDMALVVELQGMLVDAMNQGKKLKALV